MTDYAIDYKNDLFHMTQKSLKTLKGRYTGFKVEEKKENYDKIKKALFKPTVNQEKDRMEKIAAQERYARKV